MRTIVEHQDPGETHSAHGFARELARFVRYLLTGKHGTPGAGQQASGLATAPARLPAAAGRPGEREERR